MRLRDASGASPGAAARRAAVLGLAALVLAGVPPGPAQPAEGRGWVRRLEVEGAAPVPEEGTGSGTALRERALRAAVARAVDAVALELLAGSPRALPAFDAESLDAILGPDRFDYAVRFGVVQDRGLQPSREPAGSAAEAEYVIRASVHVDVARVRSRLEAAGLLEPPEPAAPGRRLEVVLEPVDSYAALAWIRRAIEAAGAGSATPAELSRGRAVLWVTTSMAPEELLGVLRREGPPGLRLTLRSLDARSLVLRAEARDLAPPGSEGSAGNGAAGSGRFLRGD